MTVRSQEAVARAVDLRWIRRELPAVLYHDEELGAPCPRSQRIAGLVIGRLGEGADDDEPDCVGRAGALAAVG
jgi:hypothetical protein